MSFSLAVGGTSGRDLPGFNIEDEIKHLVFNIISIIGQTLYYVKPIKWNIHTHNCFAYKSVIKLKLLTFFTVSNL